MSLDGPVTAGPVTIRRIGADDGSLLRALRVRSLSDAPQAFGESLEDALARPITDWRRTAVQASHGDSRAWLIAEQCGSAVGLVQGRRRPPATLLLFSMWVDPVARRLGVGGQLIEGLEGWASGWQAKETILWVLLANEPALGFYRHLGFEVVDVGTDAEAGARYAALAMRRTLGSTRAVGRAEA